MRKIGIMFAISTFIAGMVMQVDGGENDLEYTFQKRIIDKSQIRHEVLVDFPTYANKIDDVSFDLTISDIELISWITMAEAEGECEEGKRLVIDTILNRVDSGRFPNSVNEVIFQENQFSCVSDGRIERVSPNEYVSDLVREELVRRTNYDVVYFRAGKYGAYGEPMFKVGNHYFSNIGKE